MSRTGSTSLVLVVMALLGALLPTETTHAVTGAGSPAAAALAATPATSRGPLRILMTGDSITHGFHGDYSWRYRLWGEFRRQRVAVDFVGSRSAPYVSPGYPGSSYLAPGFDRNHFAQGGSLLAWHAGQIEREVRSQRPDIVLLAAGINDLRRGASPAQTAQRLRAWVHAARQARPDVRLVLSPVLGSSMPTRPSLGRRISEYNGLLRSAAVELSTPVSPITVADTARGWSAAAHTYDNLHPNPTGETLIAQRLAEAFHRIGVLPRTSALFRTTGWNRQPRVRVVLQGRRAVLTWDGQTIDGVRVWTRRKGRKASFPVAVRPRSTLRTGLLARRATYEFRIQMVRGRLATPLGPVTRVRVPGRKAPISKAR